MKRIEGSIRESKKFPLKTQLPARPEELLTRTGSLSPRHSYGFTQTHFIKSEQTQLLTQAKLLYTCICCRDSTKKWAFFLQQSHLVHIRYPLLFHLGKQWQGDGDGDSIPGGRCESVPYESLIKGAGGSSKSLRRKAQSHQPGSLGKRSHIKFKSH